MRTLSTLSALALVLAVPLQAQVIFQSGFEQWTGNTPDDWFGSKTNIAASNVSQVDVDPQSGDYAVRLQNTASGHQRFTTQPLTVVTGETYEITFWVRGSGEVRTGLFDGRTSLSGYFYNSYATATATWTQVTQQITAATDTTLAEFILSVRNTIEPEHLVIDDVNISIVTVEPPTTVSIQEIQESTAPDGGSPLAGTTVTTHGVVTAVVGTSGFFMQDGAGAWSGIYVFYNPAGLVRGDSISVTGNVVEFNGQTQISGVTALQNLGSGLSVPQTVVSTAEANTEPFESVLVTVLGATCTASGQFGQFTVNDGSDPVLVDDVIYAYGFSVGTVYNITGVLQYAFSEWRILPRDNDDVDIVTGITDMDGLQGTRIYPNPASELLMIEPANTVVRTEYHLADATGRTIRTGVLLQERATLDVSDLANGAYVLTLRNGGSMWNTRVMVQR